MTSCCCADTHKHNDKQKIWWTHHPHCSQSGDSNQMWYSAIREIIKTSQMKPLEATGNKHGVNKYSRSR